MSKRRVVITGMGVISPIANTVDGFWNGLLAGVSGIRRITQFDASELPCQIAGEITNFDPHDYMDKKEARRIPRSSQIALAATMDAMADADLEHGPPDPLRTAVSYGTGMGGLDWAIDNTLVLRNKGVSRVNPFSITGSIPNLPAYLISSNFQCLGANKTIVTACATGTQAVAEGADLIRHDLADIVVTGGTEALVQDFAIGGFCAMRALPTNFNDAPEKASRPFDFNREGFIFSEGAGTLVLEELQHALQRGASIYAEVIGHASSADGFHIAAPDPEGSGPMRAMQWAIEDAGIQPGDIDYINAHGTSTPLNDATETRAIKRLFGDQAYDIPISSTKSMTGHAMGASGALEAIACVKTINTGRIAPTINYETPDPECDLNYTPNHSIERDIHITLSNSFGLGGQNACIVIRDFIKESE